MSVNSATAQTEHSPTVPVGTQLAVDAKQQQEQILQNLKEHLVDLDAFKGVTLTTEIDPSQTYELKRGVLVQQLHNISNGTCKEKAIAITLLALAVLSIVGIAYVVYALVQYNNEASNLEQMQKYQAALQEYQTQYPDEDGGSTGGSVSGHSRTPSPLPAVPGTSVSQPSAASSTIAPADQGEDTTVGAGTQAAEHGSTPSPSSTVVPPPSTLPAPVAGSDTEDGVQDSGDDAGSTQSGDGATGDEATALPSATVGPQQSVQGDAGSEHGSDGRTSPELVVSGSNVPQPSAASSTIAPADQGEDTTVGAGTQAAEHGSTPSPSPTALPLPPLPLTSVAGSDSEDGVQDSGDDAGSTQSGDGATGDEATALPSATAGPQQPVQGDAGSEHGSDGRTSPVLVVSGSSVPQPSAASSTIAPADQGEDTTVGAGAGAVEHGSTPPPSSTVVPPPLTPSAPVAGSDSEDEAQDSGDVAIAQTGLATVPQQLVQADAESEHGRTSPVPTVPSSAPQDGGVGDGAATAGTGAGAGAGGSSSNGGSTVPKTETLAAMPIVRGFWFTETRAASKRKLETWRETAANFVGGPRPTSGKAEQAEWDRVAKGFINSTRNF